VSGVVTTQVDGSHRAWQRCSRRWMAVVGWGNDAAWRPCWGEWAAAGRQTGPRVGLREAMGKG
jgi:hypothetical protein